tara:strand:- start:3013 stop:4749 length:1737 start_codon:yes stop_codon:yes gene_type:complete
MSYFLGIFGGGGPNPSAALINNCKLIAFAEEERFSRVKNAPGALPIASILYCINEAGISIDEVEEVGIGWDCERYNEEMPSFFAQIADKYSDFDNSYNLLHENILLTSYHPHRIKENLKFGLAKYNQFINLNKIVFHHHHLCHAASTYYASTFDEASILTIDGSGEEYTTIQWEARGMMISPLKEHKLPNSVGGYYATFTEYLGFRADSEEGKLMGLAPYGRYSDKIQGKLSEFLSFDIKTGNYRIDPTFRFFGKREYNSKFTDKLVETFGPPRFKGHSITQRHKDIAYNVQWRLEKLASSLARHTIELTGIRNLCIAGGVGMNCKMNGALASLPEVNEIHVQPASSDNGVALGAALLSSINHGKRPKNIMPHVYFGPSFNDHEIELALKEAKVSYKKPKNLCKTIAKNIFEGKIVGWFQGRSEVGARALGARSILANPLMVNMREKLNAEVKHREPWRPFCPSLTAEAYPIYFGDAKLSEHMILAFPVVEKYRDLIPAAVHVDGTARPQAVNKNINPIFHKLLAEFGDLSGHPLLINTSFNIQGEPIVNAPRDALRCFGGTGIDVLAIGSFVVEKNL